MADSLDPDPHGTRGSTEHHALDYKKEVKSFNSSDILAAFNAATSGARDNGVPSSSKSAPSGGGGGGSAADNAPNIHGALDSKQEVAAFSSSDILANLEKAKQGDFTAGPIASRPRANPPAAGQAAGAGGDGQVDDESGHRIRSWTDEKEPKDAGFSFDGFRDALAPDTKPSPLPAATPVATPSKPPPNLLDLEADDPPANPYAPTPDSEWADLESNLDAPSPAAAPPSAPLASPTVVMKHMPPPEMPPPTPPLAPPPNALPPQPPAPPSAAPFMPPPNMPPPNMPPPNMPPPNMPPTNMPPPNMPPPNMPPPNMPPPNMPPPNMPPPNMPPPNMPPPSTVSL